MCYIEISNKLKPYKNKVKMVNRRCKSVDEIPQIVSKLGKQIKSVENKNCTSPTRILSLKRSLILIEESSHNLLNVH